MTPITWQASVNDEQRPLLQDILEAAVDGWRQLTSKNSSYCCKTSSKQPLMGITSRENSRGGFPLPSSRFLLSNVLLLERRLLLPSKFFTVIIAITFMNLFLWCGADHCSFYRLVDLTHPCSGDCGKKRMCGSADV